MIGRYEHLEYASPIALVNFFVCIERLEYSRAQRGSSQLPEAA